MRCHVNIFDPIAPDFAADSRGVKQRRRDDGKLSRLLIVELGLIGMWLRRR
jgi:hypothetical protein